MKKKNKSEIMEELYDDYIDSDIDKEHETMENKNLFEPTGDILTDYNILTCDQFFAIYDYPNLRESDSDGE